MSHTWMHINTSWRARGCVECIMRHTWMSHGTNTSEPCATYECAMPHICMTFMSECHSIPSLHSRVRNAHTFLTTCIYMCMHEMCARFSLATMESIAFRVQMWRWYRVAFWVRNMQHISTPHDTNATRFNRYISEPCATYECVSHTMNDTTKLHVIVVFRRAHLLVFPSLVTFSHHVAHTNDTHLSTTLSTTLITIVALRCAYHKCPYPLLSSPYHT